MQFGSLNFLEPSGPVQACNGTALPLPLPKQQVMKVLGIKVKRPLILSRDIKLDWSANSEVGLTGEKPIRAYGIIPACRRQPSAYKQQTNAVTLLGTSSVVRGVHWATTEFVTREKN